MHRRRILTRFALSTVAGTAILFGATTWFLWHESLGAEERAIAQLAERTGRHAERIFVDARAMLERFNGLSVPPCSEAHLRAMDRAAFDAPHIVAISYWRGAQRQCGAGFSQAIQLKPPQADRIYDSGVVAWWPGPDTKAAGVELFLMRYGQHDVAIDPRVLLDSTPVQGRRIGLWVDGLRMSSAPAGADLPAPSAVSEGLAVDDGTGRIVSRFSLGTVVPIDIVVAEATESFWARQWPTLTAAGAVGFLLVVIWVFLVVRYSRRRLSLGAELRDSLADGRVTARYQPIIDLATGRCVGAEALARWNRENGEPVPPDTFIPVAERAGLVPEVTLAVLDATLADLGSLLRESPHLRINLNLAPEDLERPDFARAMGDRLAAAGVPPSCIKLEITERSLVNSDAARATIDRFRAQGHEVAIDDFGTGYSSLSYLESFALDTLKIDKSFVDAIGAEAVTSEVVRHVIRLARSLDLEMVAEGIETRVQCDWLLDNGVHLGQGYVFSQPLSARRFRAFVHARGRLNVYDFPRKPGQPGVPHSA